MIPRNKLKILNDPIYGFITIHNELLFDIIEHKYFQRLRRISQMGLSYLVYPGAHHTRFHHALGCMHLMQKSVRVLRFKGVDISDEEEEALQIAILLHDMGHGPFSHAMEHSIVEGVSHEKISSLFMQEMIGRGILFQGVYLPCYTHTATDLDRIIEAFNASCQVYAEALEKGAEGFLVGPAARPVFRKYNGCLQVCPASPCPHEATCRS